jgi:hypothetical protein
MKLLTTRFPKEIVRRIIRIWNRIEKEESETLSTSIAIRGMTDITPFLH